MARLRVLHVAQPTTAGVARVAADLVRDQVARGWAVVLASPADGHLAAEVRDAGAEWREWQAGREPGAGVPAEVLRLIQVVRRVRPDVVHLHSSKAGLAGRLAVRGRIPTVFQPHAWSFLALEGRSRPLAARWERVAAARWTGALAVVSAEEQAAGEAEGIRAPYVHLPNGIDLARRPVATHGDRSAARAALDLPDGPLAVCVGRLSRQKGQDGLLAAWPRVSASVPSASLVLVGDGPDASALEQALPPGASMVGGVTDADPWLRVADVVVLPSRWEAGLSLVAMEAMALGRSVVSTAVAGVREGLAGAGAVVPVDDVAALADAVAVRLRDAELAAREGRNGRRRVEQAHDLAVTTERAARLYLRLVEGRPG